MEVRGSGNIRNSAIVKKLIKLKEDVKISRTVNVATEPGLVKSTHRQVVGQKTK